MRHLVQEGSLHAAGTQLVHPERGLVLEGGPPWVEDVAEVVVEQAADRAHVEVGEATQP
ncbi:hypothetical protein chiPu_0022525, partial [Chiloscyllium punctatum]|nr:hypothetical protein [Chiloscyllium punctatum]